MEECSPFKDLTNIPPTGPSASTSIAHDSKKAPTGKGGWYAQLSDLKKAEYLNKLRVSRQQKQAAAAVNVKVNEPPSSLLGSVDPTHFKDVTNILTNADNTSRTINSTVVDEPQNGKGKSGQGWYTRLSDENKAAYLEKLRISRQQKKVAALGPNVAKLGASSPLVSPDICEVGSKQSVVTHLAGTPSVVATSGMEPTMTTDDDSDWLHRNNTYQRVTTRYLIASTPSCEQQGSATFTKTNSSSLPHSHDVLCTPGSVVLDVPNNRKSAESKRLCDRVQYSSMRPDQIDALRKKMREYNMTRLSGVAMTDEVMLDAQDEQMPLNMTSVTPHGQTPHGLNGVATTDKVMHDAQYERMALKMPI